MEGPGRTPDHGLGARELSDLRVGANPLALRAVAAIEQVPATHQHAEVVRAVVMIAIWAAAQTVHSKDVHRPVDAPLEAIEARDVVAGGRHAGLNTLQERCWGDLLRVFDRTRGSERYSLRLAAEINKTEMSKPKNRMLVVILKNTTSRLCEQESASRKSRH
jgi:hypothetical protein